MQRESKLEPAEKQRQGVKKKEDEGIERERGSTASDALGSYANRSRLEHQRAAKYSWPTRSFSDDRSVVDWWIPHEGHEFNGESIAKLPPATKLPSCLLPNFYSDFFQELWALCRYCRYSSLRVNAMFRYAVFITWKKIPCLVYI